jgi:choline kinase
MRIDLEDIMFWMDAIRNSDDRYRTLESFWKGQLRSKKWLIERLEETLPLFHSPKKVVIHGGWNGVLASMMFNSTISIDHITSIDIDPGCKETATTMNKKYEMQGKFRAVTSDMVYHYENADIVINTSCEHITQDQYNKWLLNQPNDAVIVLQSNDYFDLDEHIRCAKDLDDFISQSNIEVSWSGIFETPKYNRFMLIGKKTNA